MFDLIQKGGPVMWIILAVSVAASVVFLQRWFHLHRAQIRAGDFLKGIFNILEKGNTVEAISICEETPGPIAPMVRAAILHRDAGRERIGQTMQEVGLAEVPRLEKNLGVLLTLAQVAPLCGLLGTVLGLMDILLAIEQKAPLVHAGDLGGGLWKALLTSAAGLAVAIPAYVGHNFLAGRVEAILLDMERAYAEAMVFFTGTGRGGYGGAGGRDAGRD